MKDSEGWHTIITWVVEAVYNEERDGWDYRVKRMDSTQTTWLEGDYWRAETELRRA